MMPSSIWGAFAQLFFMQIAAAFVVIFVLKQILHHQLIELALKKFKNTSLTDDDKKLNGIMIISKGDLKKNIQQRICFLAEEKFKRPMKIFTKQDRSLIGGIVICLNSSVIDYSIAGRMREGRLLKPKGNSLK